MNSTKKNSEFGGVKKKLTAAIAMLLVATIMMVSSTYAWFTLSTAPEVTGITTSVGANGNLEMALLNGFAKDTDDQPEVKNTYMHMDKISSAVGDSSKATSDVTKSNITWGNLVDLGAKNGDKNVYGLDKITLNPARLNVDTEGKNVQVAGGFLKTATYGNDGRVVDVNGNTYSTAHLVADAFQYDGADNQSYGVRAIGSNDNLSAQQAGLISAKASYTQHLNQAKNKVVTSVQKNGQNLTNAILSLATSETVSLTEDQTGAVDALITAFEEGAKDLDLAYVDAMRAAASALEDKAKYEAAIAALKDVTTAAAGKTALEGLSGTSVTLPGGLNDAMAALETLKGNIAAAKTETTKAEPNYKEALNKLVDTSTTSQILINGYLLRQPETGAVEEGKKYALVKGEDGKYTYDGKFMVSVVKGVTVEMPDGTGVFAEFAALSNNYTIPTIVNVEVSYGTTHIKLPNTPFTLTTTSAATNYTTTTAGVKAVTAAANGANDTTFLTGFYGYAIDLAFRTNATGSKLQLATDGLQRIYNGTDDASANPETLGGGSTMTFKAADGATLTNEQVQNLMKAIRVAFIDPDKGTIYGIAALNDIATDTEDTAAFTGKLALRSYSVVNGAITLDMTKTVDADLLDLPQNTATKLSVVVYLDGDTVNNSMVANADQSITGSLNLQFKSSADLNPMDYSPLKNGTTNP